MRTLALALSTLALLGCDGDPPAAPDGGDGGPLPDAALDGGGIGREPCGPDAGPIDAGSATGLTTLCTEELVMSGFGVRWADEARNVARLGVYPSFDEEHFPEGCPPSSTLRGADLVARLDDGATADAPASVTATYAVVGAGAGGSLPDGGGAWVGLRAARGLSIVELSLEAGAAEVSQPQLFDLGLAGMSGAPAVAVVLDGFEIDTDVAQGPGYPSGWDPAFGYAVRGLGVAIADVTRDGDDLRFSAVARFATGRAGDPDHDDARLAARVDVTVRYLVVALPVAPATGTVSYREQHHGHARDVLEVCRPEPATTALVLDGAPLPRAAPALTRFDFALYQDDTDGTPGDRLRELAVAVHGFTYDALSGEASMHVEGYVSNAGPPPPRLPMDYAFEAEVGLLQWEGAGAVDTLRVDAPISAGRTEVPMPLTPR